MDLSRPWAYIEMLAIFIIILLGTLGYWIAGVYDPFVILGLAILMLVPTRLVQFIHGLSTIDAGWVWLLWLTYGSLFYANFSEKNPWWTVLLQSLILVGVVSISYLPSIRQSLISVGVLVSLFTVALFFPHRDALAKNMSLMSLLLRSMSFYLIYSLIVTSRGGRVVKSFPERAIRIVQAGWVLVGSRFILPALVFQMALVLFETFTSRRREKEPILPLRTDTASRKRPPAEARPGVVVPEQRKSKGGKPVVSAPLYSQPSTRDHGRKPTAPEKKVISPEYKDKEHSEQLSQRPPIGNPETNGGRPSRPKPSANPPAGHAATVFDIDVLSADDLRSAYNALISEGSLVGTDGAKKTL